MWEEADRIALTIAIEMLVPVVCVLFNRYIDERAGQRFNGETAVWVACGVGGVLAVAIVVTALWWHQLPEHWAGALCVGAIIYATFLPAGVVMWWGDRVRYRNSKLAGTVKRKLH